MSRLTRLFGKNRKDHDGSESDPEEERLSDRADAEDSTQDKSHSTGDWQDDWSVTEEIMARALNDDSTSNVINGASSYVDESDQKDRPKLAKDYMSMPDLHKSKDRKKKKRDKSLKKHDEDVSPKVKKEKQRKSETLGENDEESLASSSFADSISTTKQNMDDGSDGNISVTKKEGRRTKSTKDNKKEKKKERKHKSKSDTALNISVHSVDSFGKHLGGSERHLKVESSSAGAHRSRSHSRGALNRKGHRSRSRRKRDPDDSRKSSKSRSGSGRDYTDSNEKRKRSSKTKKKEESLNEEDDFLLSNSMLDVSSAALMAPSVPLLEDNSTTGDEAQRREILRLHQMLSDALQKVANQSAEQIQDKDLFLKVSTELSKIKVDFEGIRKERDDMKSKLEERDRKIEKCVTQIDHLTLSLERQRADQAHVEADLEQSEADVDKLLIKIEDLERAADGSGGVTDMTLRNELKESKITLVDKNREVESQKSKIENLENELDYQKARVRELEMELEETMMVNKLQVEELEEDKKGLQGKLKGERLDFSFKLSQKEQTISALKEELALFRGNSEFEDISIVRKELSEITVELEAATRDLEAAQKVLTKVKGEKEDLLERNNKLNMEVKRLEKSVNELTAKSNDLGEKVLKWTEQTYEWKGRAETAEKKLLTYSDGNDIISDSGSVAEEAPQGIFLQAVMDKQENSKKSASRWSIFRNAALGSEEDQTVEEIRIKGLEEQNQTLVNKNCEIQSELVKLQAAHKDEIYTKQKQIAQLTGENEALKLKTKTLEEICAQKEESSENEIFT